MDEIVVKALNDHYVVKINVNSIHGITDTLTKRLQQCAVMKGGSFEAFFDVPKGFSEASLLELFELCQKEHVYILGFAAAEKEKELKIIKESLRSGQNYHFDTPVLILGGIPRDCFVDSRCDIYVIGDVSGNIDLYDKENTISASTFEHAFIRIHDSSWQNVTNFSPSNVYYKERNVECKEYKEERMWVRQSQ